MAAVSCSASLAYAGQEADASWLSKLDPFLRRLVAGTSVHDPAARPPRPASSVEVRRSLPPFLQLGRSAADPLHVKAWIDDTTSLAGDLPAMARLLEERGAELRGQLGPIVSLQLQPAALAAIASLPQVRWIKAAQRYAPSNEISTGPDHLAADAASSSFGSAGEGVIVAVVDTGIDWTHLDFRHPGGTTRILGIWDQTLADPDHPPPPGFSFGAYYTRADIDAALAGGDPLLTEDVFNHGTHVAGTAAGSGRDTGNGVPPGTFAGVAPAADLLAVKVFEGLDAEFCDACDLTAAVQFVGQVAEAEGQPWVVNMSLGSNLGPHDGTSPDELAIDAAVGPGRPGAQAAISAGNSGASSRHFHWEGLLQTGQVASNSFDLPSSGSPMAGSDNDFIWLDLWYAGSAEATLVLRTPDGTEVSAARGADSGIVCTPSGAVQVDATNAPDPANGDNQVFIQIWDSPSCDPVIEPQPGTYQLEVDPVVADSAPFDLWDAADTRGRSFVNLASFVLHETVTTPATGRHAITVGAYVSKNQWINGSGSTTTLTPSAPLGDLSSFSGVGPTRDGRIKPDLAAPGEYVGSSLSNQDPTPPSSSNRERDGRHHNTRGTSMSAPQAAGAAALLLALRPDLDGAQVRLALERAARSDAFTGIVPNTRFGHGKLRVLQAAYEAAALVTDLAAVSPRRFVGTDSPFMTSYNVYRGTIPGISSTSYGTCRFTGLAAPDFEDTDLPAPGSAFFYLVTGVWTDPDTAAESEGSLGTDSEGRPRPNTSPCL